MSSYVFMKILESRPSRYDLGISWLSLGRATKVMRRIVAEHVRPGTRLVRQAPLGSTASPAGRRPLSCDPPVLEAAGGTTATRVRRRRERYSGAALLMRVFAQGILRCPCGARREIIAMITACAPKPASPP